MSPLADKMEVSGRVLINLSSYLNGSNSHGTCHSQNPSIQSIMKILAVIFALVVATTCSNSKPG